MKTEKTTSPKKFKFHYIGKPKSDGWGCTPSFVEVTDMDNNRIENEDIINKGVEAFNLTIEKCGGFASTLVNIGEKDYSTFLA